MEQGIFGIFSTISTPKSPIKTKPAPETYRKVPAEIKMDSKNVVTIEYIERGMQAAKVAQIPTIVIPPQFILDPNLPECSIF